MLKNGSYSFISNDEKRHPTFLKEQEIIQILSLNQPLFSQSFKHKTNLVLQSVTLLLSSFDIINNKAKNNIIIKKTINKKIFILR